MRFVPSLSFLRRKPAIRVRVPDPADLGTAFGMEASLDPANDLRPDASAGSLESERAHPPLDNPMAWVRQRRST